MLYLMFPIILLLLQPALTDDISLNSLDDGPGIVSFKLGSARRISFYHSFLEYGNLQSSTINSIHHELNEISSKGPLFKPHIIYLKTKIFNVLKLLEIFEANLDKNVIGNLEYSHSVLYNKLLKSHHANKDDLVNEVNHISLFKNWDSKYAKAIDNTVENLNKLVVLINDGNINNTMTYADVNYTLAVDELRVKLSDNIDLIKSELNKLQNVLAFIRNSIISNEKPRVDSLGFISDYLPDMRRELSARYGKEETLQLNDTEYFNIIKLGFYGLDNGLVIVYKFPIISQNIYDFYKLAIVPNKNHEILVPPYPYLLLSEKDFKYIAAECPKTERGYICDGETYLNNQPSPDCIQQLIQTQQRIASCNPVLVSLEKPAYEALDKKKYIVSFPLLTEVHFSCGIVNEHLFDLVKTLQGSYLAVIPDQCYIKTSQFLIPNKEDGVLRQAPISLDMYNIPANVNLVLKTNHLLDLHSIYSGVYVKPLVKQDDDNSHQIFTIIIIICVVTILVLVLCLLSLAIIYFGNGRNNRSSAIPVRQEVCSLNYMNGNTGQDNSV